MEILTGVSTVCFSYSMGGGGEINPIGMFITVIIAWVLISIVWKCLYQAFTGKDVLHLHGNGNSDDDFNADDNSEADNNTNTRIRTKVSAKATEETISATPLGFVQRFAPAAAILAVIFWFVADRILGGTISPFIILSAIMLATIIFSGVTIACGAFVKADKDTDNENFGESDMCSRAKPEMASGYRRAVRSCMLLSGLAIIYGGGAFIFFAFNSSDDAPFLGEWFEWPMGYTGNVQRDHAGNYYARHNVASRLQVYNSNKVFQKGWNYDASGGGKQYMPH